MKIFGLIGNPIGHSLSQQYFREKFRREQIMDCTYELYTMNHLTGLLPLLMQSVEISGLNVTIPFKVEVIDYLDELDGLAEAVGAVNCISINRLSGRPYLVGYNTDVYGFEQSIRPRLDRPHLNALVLGTGGSSKAVSFALQRMGIHVTNVSRYPGSENEIGYNSLTGDMMAQYTLIVNTTPLGMAPDTENCPPIPYEFLSGDHLLIDLIYNPLETLFIKRGKAYGAAAVNGMEMLYLQAEKSWEIWSR